MSIANHPKRDGCVVSTACTSRLAGPALGGWPQGEPGPWCGGAECVSTESCAGCAAETDCETSSKCSPNAAATASQHGNNIALNQNAAQASTRITRPNLCRPRDCLPLDTLAILPVAENVLVKSHLCRELLTDMRVTTFTREPAPALYVAAHSDRFQSPVTREPSSGSQPTCSTTYRSTPGSGRQLLIGTPALE
jgi:hypothetical protein